MGTKLKGLLKWLTWLKRQKLVHWRNSGEAVERGCWLTSNFVSSMEKVEPEDLGEGNSIIMGYLGSY